MNGKYLIPICIMIIGNSIFDNFATVNSTNWSIFYYVSQYLSIMILVLMLPKKYKLPYYSIAGGYMLKIVIELSMLGMAFDNYIASVNNFTANILPISVMIAGLTYFILKK